MWSAEDLGRSELSCWRAVDDVLRPQEVEAEAVELLLSELPHPGFGRRADGHAEQSYERQGVSGRLGEGYEVGAVDAPTSAASAWTVTGPGFHPQFAGLGLTMLQSVDSHVTTSDAGAFALGFHDGTRGRCIGFSDEDGQGTSDSQSLFDTRWVNLTDGAGAQQFDLSPSDPFNSNGWTVDAGDIAAANATTRKWLAFAVEDPDAVGGGGLDIAIAAYHYNHHLRSQN